MSVYLNKRANRWCVAIQRGGKRIVRYAEKGASKEEANQYETKLRRELFLETLGKTPDRPLAEAIQRWLKEEVCTYKSKAKTISHILQLNKYVIGRNLSEIHLVADEYARKNHGVISNGTINRRLSMLRLIANLCYKKWDWLNQPLGMKIKLLKESEGRVPLITKEEVEAILDKAKTIPCKNAIKLAAYCGLRAGEIQKLKPEHIRANKIWLDFDQKSGVNIETAHIPKIFKLTPDMLPIGSSHRMISLYFREAVKAIGRPDIRFHDLRHAYASWIVQSGNDLYMAGKLLRHKSLASTKRYSHFQDSQKEDAVERTFG